MPQHLEQGIGTTGVMEQAIGTTGIMVLVVIMVFLLFLLLFFIYLHTKAYRGANPTARSSSNQHAVPRKGLDPTILDSLPITVFGSKDFKEGFECAVCLSELSEGEKARLLPICNHGFHLECIDMWFQSNSTCPLCRSLVCNDSMQIEVPTSEAPPNFMENVMFWDAEDLVRPGAVGVVASTNQGSSIPEEGASSMNAEGMLVIEIPRRVVDGSSSTSSQLTPIRNIEENTKSPRISRLKSLGRILSWGSKGVGSCSPRGGDFEQGTLTVPKTP